MLASCMRCLKVWDVACGGQRRLQVLLASDSSDSSCCQTCLLQALPCCSFHTAMSPLHAMQAWAACLQPALMLVLP